MVDQKALEAVAADLASRSPRHRDFFLPILRAISVLGGRARAGEVRKKLRQMLTSQLNEKQLDYLEENNRFGWVRLRLKDRGLVGGEYGFWELTELGRAYVEARAGDPAEIHAEIPESRQPASDIGETESVEVTTSQAYEIPLLAAMATSLTDKSEIMDAVEKKFGAAMLPGDLRSMPSGYPVWRYKAFRVDPNPAVIPQVRWLTGARRAALVFPSGMLADRRSFLLPAPGGPETIRVDLLEFDLGARTIGGWRDAGARLVKQIGCE